MTHAMNNAHLRSCPAAVIRAAGALVLPTPFLARMALIATIACASARAGDIPDTSPTPLALDNTISNLHGLRGTAQFFELSAPSGLTRLAVAITGGAGDADLYVRHAHPPTMREYDARPYVTGNDEEILLDAPAPGVWHVMLHAYAAYTGVCLTATGFAALGDDAAQHATPYRDMELALYYELYGADNRHEVAWTTEMRGQALSQEGRLAFNAGDYTNAIRAWQAWHTLEPDNPEPVSLTADVYLRAGDITNAIALYRRSLDIYPGQIGLVFRLARLLDTSAGQGEQARALLNFYARLFPNHPMVTLAQAEWLVRRNRHAEARDLAQAVARASAGQSAPDSLRALALSHGLLVTMSERLANFAAMLEVARQPGMAPHLAWSIYDNNLLTYPESWTLMDFLDRTAAAIPDAGRRQIFTRLLPRRAAVGEDLHMARLSQDWIASQGENIEDEGHLILRADTARTETALRLIGSDAMPNGFMDVVIDQARGFFWIYGRRGADNMVRFGFDEQGRIYLQLWINGQLLANQNRTWQRLDLSPHPRLRLELRGDAAHGYVDGAAAFDAPLAIPADMGLGWWGFAPWSPEPGRAMIMTRHISGGPLPVLLGLYYAPPDAALTAEHVARLKPYMRALSAMAPVWYQQQSDGAIVRRPADADMDFRLLCRYYRVRLLPGIEIEDHVRLDATALLELARADRVDGFTLLVKRMPPPRWIAAMEAAILNTPLSIHIMLPDANTGTVQVREMHAQVGLLPGPRRTRGMALLSGANLPRLEADAPIRTDLPDAVLQF